MKTIRTVILLSLLISLLASSLVLAQAGGDYELAWTSINAGGGVMTGGAYSLASSIAQPEPGETQSGGDYDLNGGVVDAGSSDQSTPVEQHVFVPLILK